MAYERTPEIRQKQREAMLQRHRENPYDFKEIRKKADATLERRGIKLGRKKGEGREKNGFFKKCKACDNEIYVTNYNVNKRFYCSRSCMYEDQAYKEKLTVKRPFYTRAPRNPLLPEYRRYVGKVYRLTEETYAQYCQIINPNHYPRTLCGVEGGYQLDHIISIKRCWNEGKSPAEAASFTNLQIIPWRENLDKRTFEIVMEK